MNKSYTEIAFILDRSGSMDSCQDAAIEGFNRFLRDQQQAEGLAKLTLVLFDDEYLVAAQSIPVQGLVALTRETYVPRNTTALLDAIGRTIDDLGTRLGQIPEEDRPGQLIVTILMDGLENASHRFTWRDVAAKIKHQTENYNWTFPFLGANQDAIATAAPMNIAAANSATYAANEVGARSSMVRDRPGRRSQGTRGVRGGLCGSQRSLASTASFRSRRRIMGPKPITGIGFSLDCALAQPLKPCCNQQTSCNPIHLSQKITPCDRIALIHTIPPTA
ncbi:MAG: VWA domain-containing protein [Verrucomicrobiota bacterium]